MSDVFRMEGAYFLRANGSTFSPANFEDCGEKTSCLKNEFTSSKDYVSMSKIIENLSESVLNVIEDEFVNREKTIENSTNIKEHFYMHNKYNSLKNKIISLGCAGHLEQIEKFLKPIDEHISYKIIKDFTSKLDVEIFNGSSKDFLPNLTLDLSGADFFKDEFGTDLGTFKSTFNKVLESYHKSYFDLFDADGRLNSTVKKFTELSKQLNTMLDLEVNDASLEVFKSVTKYICEFFKTQNLKSSFDEFIKERKRFVTLRNIITRSRNAISYTDEPVLSPPCSICMNEPVKTAFIPCGHTFCLGCAHKNLSSCYICRAKIEKKLKLYFS